MTVGEHIKKIRQEKKLSQKELGDRLGVSQQMIGQYENPNSKLKLDTLQKIADALDVPLKEIFSIVENDENMIDLTSLDTKEQIELAFETISSKKTRLDECFEKLNAYGKEEALKRVEELTEIPRYTIKEK